MQIRVIKFDIPLGGAGSSGTGVDANGENLPPAETARAVIAVANMAHSNTGTTTATSPNLNGSVGFGIVTGGAVGGAGTTEQSCCISFTSRGIENPIFAGDDDSVTAAKRRGVSGVPIYMQDPYGNAGGYEGGEYALYAEVNFGSVTFGGVGLTWRGDAALPSFVYGGGTVLLYVIYGSDVLCDFGRDNAPHDAQLGAGNASPKFFPTSYRSEGSEQPFTPDLVFTLAAALDLPWQDAAGASQNTTQSDDACLSFGIAHLKYDASDGTISADNRSLAWRDSHGLDTSASGLYLSDDYGLVGDVSNAGAVVSPHEVTYVKHTDGAQEVRDGFEMTLKSGLLGFQLGWLAIKSDTPVSLETFTTPNATGYANQSVGGGIDNPQSIFAIQTQVPSASMDTGMTNPVSATFGFGMGHQTSLNQDPVTYSLGFQVEDNSATRDTQSSWASQIGYLVKRHGAATVSDFDWVKHADGSADPDSVDWVTNTTSTGVVYRQWIALYIGKGNTIDMPDDLAQGSDRQHIRIVPMSLDPYYFPGTGHFVDNGQLPQTIDLEDLGFWYNHGRVGILAQESNARVYTSTLINLTEDQSPALGVEEQSDTWFDDGTQYLVTAGQYSIDFEGVELSPVRIEGGQWFDDGFSVLAVDDPSISMDSVSAEVVVSSGTTLIIVNGDQSVDLPDGIELPISVSRVEVGHLIPAGGHNVESLVLADAVTYRETTDALIWEVKADQTSVTTVTELPTVWTRTETSRATTITEPTDKPYTA